MRSAFNGLLGDVVQFPASRAAGSAVQAVQDELDRVTKFLREHGSTRPTRDDGPQIQGSWLYHAMLKRKLQRLRAQAKAAPSAPVVPLRGGLGFLIDRSLPPGKCARKMRPDGSTTDFCNPDEPPKPSKRKKRAKAGKKKTWKFPGGRRSQVRTAGRMHCVYRYFPGSKRWAKSSSHRKFATAQRAAARWNAGSRGVLKGR